MNHYVQEGVYYKKEKERGKLRYCKAWSFNLSEMSIQDLLLSVKKIVYTTEKAIYSIDTRTALDKGFIRKHGKENKLIIPIQHWEKQKVVE